VKQLNILVITFLSLISLSWGADNNLRLTWFGTTCLNITDGKNALFFDPFITRPSLFQLATFQRLNSDEKLIDSWLGKLKDNNIEALFASHTHYDHALDLVSLQKRTKAKVYGGASVLNILKGAALETSFHKVSHGDVIKVGDFKVTIYKGIHPPHLFSFTLASGIIERPLVHGATALEYKLGEVFSYLIEHPKGKILFHPAGQVLDAELFKRMGKVDLLIQGIAKRESTKDLLEKLILPLDPKVVIPVHYDDFLEPLDEGIQEMMTMNLDEFKKSVLKARPGQKISLPKYGEEVGLF
jgi:L-ascorbate metabolism protein UlaG (beta-lactamase superfamily)